MPIDRDLTRKGAYWLVSVVSSVVIFAASMTFLVDTGRSFFVPSATAAVADERPVRVAEVASSPKEEDATPVPAITNGPPPAIKPPPATVAAVVPAAPVAPPAATAAPVVTVAAPAGVNVRSAARSGSAKLGTLAHGTRVAVLESQGAWTHIATDTLEGWVFSKYLAAE